MERNALGQRPVSSLAKHVAISEGGLGFDYRVGHSVANDSPPGP